MLHAFNYFNSNVNSFFHGVLQLVKEVACMSFMLCLLQTGVGLESPKEELTEGFCLSSAIHYVFE